MKKLLLHTCCAPCSGYLADELAKDYAVAIYYDNPNIFPKEEFLKRSDEAAKYFARRGFEFIQPDYHHEDWLELVKGLEGVPERSERCLVCYHFRLSRTANYAKQNGFDYFASTLAISPHKDAQAINSIGDALSAQVGVNFLAGDWKKNDGFKHAMEFSCEHDFYRQNYCGCEFSMNNCSQPL